MINRMITWLFLAIIVVTSLVFFPIALLLRIVTRPLDRRLRLLHLYTCFWGGFYTYIMPAWPVTIEGREKITGAGDRARVLVSNHQSQLDILVLFRLYVHFKWVSKSEIFRLPLIGWNMVLNRYIKLRRGDRTSVQQMMADSRERLDEGSSVFIFPEGSRSPDGNLKAFKPGAFILAREQHVPIVPVVVEGTRFALPKYSIDFHGKHPIRVRVLDEIPYERFADKTVEETADLVRQVINDELARLREEMYGEQEGSASPA